MSLVRLIYVSIKTDQCSDAELENILSIARENNSKLGITGLLMFNKSFFVQCLEGSGSEVNRLYNHIIADPRHENVQILELKEIAQREFYDWSMGYVPNISVTENIIYKYSAAKELNPYTMSAESVYRLLLDLKRTVPTV